ncbi:TerC/Alx family metal homeostasis membrane protein [Actinopolymorpha pittospori]|uniref:Tellurite resistance protein TerC n=1 Tax=Actinopolymorpha pittospori TaxID=648752 RepID=A0A927MZB5_9ACTN|nr:tellurite resistance protein TerC [Actinopolymorpha pittospori]
MTIEPWVWVATVGVLVAILVADVLIIGRRPHEPSMRESVSWIALYVTLAVIFGIGVWFLAGGQYAGEFFAGWLTEYSLSVDNLFVFLVILTRFGVPRKYQQTALLIGIILALVMRGFFIAIGAAAISAFAWVFYIFGAILIYTAIQFVRGGTGEESEYKENAVIRWAKKNLPATDSYNGVKLTIVENGKRLVTPMLLVMIALGTTDLLFALDSIPAIYGLTKEPYLVFAANVFALMGLRQLYFLIGGLVTRLVYLPIGLAVILGFIGVKLILHALHENNLPFVNGGDPMHSVPDIGIAVSLGVIVGTLLITTVASLLKSRNTAQKKDDEEPAQTH